jgi:hypothetical protein
MSGARETYCHTCLEVRDDLYECGECGQIYCGDCRDNHDPSLCTTTEAAHAPQKIEVTAQCQSCGARLTLPMPDAWGLPNGESVKADESEEDIRAMIQAMQEMPCPSCGKVELKVALPSGEL